MLIAGCILYGLEGPCRKVDSRYSRWSWITVKGRDGAQSLMIID